MGQPHLISVIVLELSLLVLDTVFGLLLEPKFKTSSTLGDCTFVASAPNLWNELITHHT